jgi:murein DD-endopeptidase MepM/ murein hydrolase activator NlpD
LSAQLGRSKTNFRLWQDQKAIAPGKLWEEEIKTAVEQAVFFIPIVTPRAVNSHYCKFEFEAFLAREGALGRTDLVFPLHSIRIPALENEAQWREDPVLSIIGTRQYVDWRGLRNRDIREPILREAIERFCEKIAEALREPWLSREERQRQQEAEAKRRAEEERQAEAARLAKEREQQAEVARLAKEREQQAEVARLAREREQQAEAARKAEEEQRRAEAARKAAEEQRQAEAARHANQDTPRSGATQIGREEKTSFLGELFGEAAGASERHCCVPRCRAKRRSMPARITARTRISRARTAMPGRITARTRISAAETLAANTSPAAATRRWRGRPKRRSDAQSRHGGRLLKKLKSEKDPRL